MKLSRKQFIDNTIGVAMIFINVLFARGLGLLLCRDHSLKKKPAAIIITKMLGLGSLLMAADAVLAIKKKYPEARLILVCSRLLENEVRALALFDEVWAIDDRTFSKLVSSALRTLFRSWRCRNLWVVNLEVYSRLSTIFSLWSLAQNRFGFYFNEVKFRYALNTHHVYFNPMVLAYENYAQMANALGAAVGETYYFPVSIRAGAAHYIAVNNSCSELAKERLIPQDILIAVLLQLAAHFTLDIALVGSKTDYESNEMIRCDPRLSGISNRMINVAGKYAFPDFLKFLKQECALLLTIDSGPLHFAYRLRMPTVSVWGPTHPATRIPASFPHPAIYLGVPCSPCVHLTDILPCGGDNFCMKNISAAEISGAVSSTIHQYYAREFAVS